MPESKEKTMAQQLALISELADNPLTLPPIFVPITGSITAGLLLRQVMYWMKRTKAPGGWFYKRLEEFQEEMCMGEKEFRLARKANESRKFIETERRGVPPVVWFRANLGAVLEAINKQLESESNSGKKEQSNSAQRAESIAPEGQDQLGPNVGAIPPKGQKYDSAQRAELYKEAETTRDHPETTGAKRNGRLSQSERDTMDWNRFTSWFHNRLAPTEGEYIAEDHRERELTERAIKACEMGGVSKARAQELLRQFYPGQQWVEDITRQLPLLGESA
jgi:hypothetical protein